jgi:hypothetical protein
MFTCVVCENMRNVRGKARTCLICAVSESRRNHVSRVRKKFHIKNS